MTSGTNLSATSSPDGCQAQADNGSQVDPTTGRIFPTPKTEHPATMGGMLGKSDLPA